MITNLALKQFGKFRDRDFPLAPVTLFYGENEAGKTTLFDALMDGLCSPPGTKASGKRLAERYGLRDKERFCRLAFEGEPFSIDEADFLNLFAVRSGTISLEIDKNQKGSEWMKAVKAALFSGGIDPQAAAAKLGAEIGSKAKGSLNKEAQTINGELKSLQAEFEKLTRDRQECLDMEMKVRQMGARAGEKEKEAAALKAELVKLEKSLEQQGLIQKKKNAESVLSDIADILRKSGELKNHSRFTPDGQEKIRLKAGEADARRAEAEKAFSGEREAEENRGRFVAEQNRRADDLDRARKAKALAEGLKSRIVPRESLVRKKTRLAVRKTLLAAALAVLFAAALGGLLGPAAYRAWFFGGGGFAAALLGVFSFYRTMWEDVGGLEAAMAAARESWKKETGEDAGGSYEEILGAFERARERAAAAEENFQSIRRQTAANEEEIARLALAAKKAAQAREASRQGLKEMLDAAGVGGLEEYASRLATKNALQKQYGELEAKLAAARAENQAASPHALEDLLRRRAAELGEKITMREMPPAEVQRRENLRRQKRQLLEALREEEKKNKEDLGRKDGLFRGQFQGIPERLAACGKNIAQRNRRLEEIKLEMEAGKIAQEIFLSLSEDSGAMLEELSREIGKIFSAFTGEDRAVRFEGFSVDSARVCDSSGQPRQTGETGPTLSAGTRDAFLLAARLALARKASSGGRALVVLDEPFIALDRNRTGRGLAVLKEFFDKTGWQIILFTKDEALEKQARAVFGRELLVHGLAGK
ncbi:MAG: AAA family ATPase [Spirochaetia bacterium]|jgi:DNA sulfur modification protein DndD|nr:AAA family ATPase [Spirochaetia bacterium]